MVHISGIKNTKTGLDLSVEYAIRTGVLDIPHGVYVNLNEETDVTIPEAVDEGLMEADTAKKIYDAMSKSSLSKGIFFVILF